MSESGVQSLLNFDLSFYDYELPSELIAYHPPAQRTHSKLMLLPIQENRYEHAQFHQLPNFLNPGDLLIVNNSKVMAARLAAHKLTGAKVEILIERIIAPHQVLAHLKSTHPLKKNTPLLIGPVAENLTAMVIDRQDNLFILESEHLWSKIIAEQGQIPLPPYIKRNPEILDENRYQTVYAKTLGSVAAPTAGLHFDETLLKTLKDKGIETASVTLHVGAGTFQPIRTADLRQHTMHSEWVSVNAATCEKINETKKRGGRVIAVGTTAVRSLETAILFGAGTLNPYEGETQLFIYPGFKFRVVDGIITNFHWPQSTLLLLVSAFANPSYIMKAYEEAILNRYRFYSYGDAMFIF